MRRRRAIVCSLGSGEHRALLAIARPSLAAWAQRWGFDLDLRDEVLDVSRPPSWSKLLLIREHLATHDHVVWVDADCVVVDTSHDPTALVSRRRPIGLVAHRYHGQVVPNMGVMVVRRGRVARRLVDELWAMDQYRDHKWWENAALLDRLGYDIATEPIVKQRASPLDRRMAWLDRAWNSIDLDRSDRPIVVHFPGLSNDERRVRMTALAANSHPGAAGA